MRYIFLLLVLTSQLSCRKDDSQEIPDVLVDFKFTATEFENATINTNDKIWLVKGHGVAGLIIIKESINQFKAFDRCSPVNPANRCAVVPQNGGLSAKDPCSGAIFTLTDGNPATISTRPLKQYAIHAVGNQFIVTN
jgi:hypothetical protein